MTGRLSRAIVSIDEKDYITYTEQVADIAQEQEQDYGTTLINITP